MYWPPTEGLEKAGLDLLFMLRGPLPQPPKVRVVAIDDDSYAEFGRRPDQRLAARACTAS